MKYLALLLIPISLFAEVKTTGNLIVNPGFNDGTNGWTLSGDAQRIGDCCPGGHDLEFGDYGSIEQSFNLIDDSVTQSMLDNGITLDSTVEVQNGEGGVGSWAPNRGGADTFTIRLQIQDENQNVLATTTQERTNVTGINGKDFSDSVTYTGSDSNIGNIFISGSDANAPARLGGPNVDNISVTMTYDPVVLTTEQTFVQTNEGLVGVSIQSFSEQKKEDLIHGLVTRVLDLSVEIQKSDQHYGFRSSNVQYFQFDELEEEKMSYIQSLQLSGVRYRNAKRNKNLNGGSLSHSIDSAWRSSISSQWNLFSRRWDPPPKEHKYN